MSALYSLSIVAVSVAIVFFLVMRLNLHAFATLLLASFAAAIAAGIPLGDVAGVVEEGLGSALGFIAVVVGLGAMFGEILRMTGGAEGIANALVGRFGEEWVPWAMAITGFVVPVFFDVALVLLITLLYTLAARYGRSLLFYGIPLAAGLSVAHGSATARLLRARVEGLLLPRGGAGGGGQGAGTGRYRGRSGGFLADNDPAGRIRRVRGVGPDPDFSRLGYGGRRRGGHGRGSPDAGGSCRRMSAWSRSAWP